MNRVSAPGAPYTDHLQVLVQSHSTTASSASPNSLKHSLQLYLQTRLITASKCISKLARSRPTGASPNLLDHGLQLYLQTHMITASKFSRSWPPSVYLQTRSITASGCISKLTRSRPLRASPTSLDHGLQLYLQIRSITASKCISKLA